MRLDFSGHFKTDPSFKTQHLRVHGESKKKKEPRGVGRVRVGTIPKMTQATVAPFLPPCIPRAGYF